VFSFNCWHIDLMFIARNVWPLCAVVCGVIVTIRVRWISCSGTPGTEKCARNYHPKHERMKSLARINKSSSVRTNVTMKCVRVTIVAIKSNKYYIFWVCVCVCVCCLFYTACKAHAPYCHLWPARLSYCSTLSHSRQNFVEKKSYWT